MSKVDKETIDKIANLARLEFEYEAKEEIADDLSKMLAFVSKLNQLDTSNTEPLVHVNDEVNILREDIVKQKITQQDALRNAPKKDSDYFKAPKVLAATKPSKVEKK